MSQSFIRSRQNAKIKRLRALFSGTADDNGLAVVEGEHLVQEALGSRVRVQEIFLRQGAEHKFSAVLHALAPGIAVHVAAPEIFNSVVNVAAPQGIAAVLEVPFHAPSTTLAEGAPMAVLLDAVQDPGNVGTIVRSAEAFGAHAVIALAGTADGWGPKALRASAGSIFRVPFFALEPDAAEVLVRRHKLRLVAAVAQGGAAPEAVEWRGPTGLIIGSEGAGVSERWLRQANAAVTLPLSGAVESLNAGVAASLLLYAASKARG